MAKGMTLIELMIVVALLGIIGALAIPMYANYVKTGKASECYNEVAAIQLAQAEFFLENNSYFTGNDATELRNQSNGLYQPSAEALAGTSNCGYVVTSADPTATYTITATGQNDLNGEGTIMTKTK